MATFSTLSTTPLSFAEVEALCLLLEEFNSSDAGREAADRREDDLAREAA